MATPTRVPSILIVDDEPEVRARMCASLSAGSFHCMPVESARHALDVVRHTAVDVALLDISSSRPGESVWLARRLRDEVRDLAVVGVGAPFSMHTAIEAMRIGVIDYLPKPVSAGELVDAIDRAVEWRWSALEARADRRHEGEINERTARLTRALAESAVASSCALEAWLASVYAADRETLEHARRVSHLSSVMALMLGIDETLIGHIERAGLLHDIGKLAIPKGIVRTPGPLTTDQAGRLRLHVQASSEIASSTPFLRPAAGILIATRERYDGSGYPRGLRGDEIPVGARIIAVAEVFDALTSASAQAPPAAAAAADAELIRGAGLLFDPDVVMASLRCSEVGAFGRALPFDGRWRRT